MYRPTIQRIRECKPMIHCITNSVTARDCANILLAIGGSAIMAEAKEEVTEITSLCDGLVLNIGMLTQDKLSAMLLAGRQANKMGIPVVLDPVGVGASSFRRRAVTQLLKELSVRAIRGNYSEIKALLDEKAVSHGVEAAGEDIREQANREDMVAMCRELSKQHHCVTVMSGEHDIITDKEDACVVHNGHAMMSRITGAGCQLSALLCAFLTEKNDAGEPESSFDFYNSLMAVCTMGVCGELAYEGFLEGEGNASFGTRLIDMVYHITDVKRMERERYELLC